MSKKELLVGSRAVRSQIKNGSDPGSIYPFAELLVNDEIPLPNASTGDSSENWPRDRIIDQVRLIARVIMNEVDLPQDYQRKKVVNRKRLKRARRLGQFAPWTTVVNEFGSGVGLYHAAGLRETHRQNVFDDWEVEQFITHVKKVGALEARRPTEDLLYQYHRRNPWKYPHPSLIAQRVGDGRKIGNAIELAGWLDIYNWSLDDYRDWGVRFMRANDGLEPTARLLNYLSQKKKGPSARAVMNNFGIADYKDQVSELYLSEEARRQSDRSRKLMTIEQLSKMGVIPSAVFADAKTDDEKIVRYARYVVATELLPDTQTDRCVSISNPYRSSGDTRGLIACIRHENPAVSAGDIENTALYRGFFDDLWPMDEFMTDLRIPDELVWVGNKRVNLAMAA